MGKRVFPPLLPPSQNRPLFLPLNMQRSLNLPLCPRIYPPFAQLYATPPEFTPPSQNLPPFKLQNVYLTFPEYTFSPRIYPLLYLCTTLPESSTPPKIDPLFYNCMRRSHNLPLLSRVYLTIPLQYLTLLKSTLPS